MFKDENRHYSLRKLSVGLASVLIGISFASGNSHTVKADTVKDGSNGAQTVVQTTADDSTAVVKDHDATAEANAKDNANTAIKANAESTPKEQSQTPEAVKKNSDAITQDIRQKAVKASEAITKRQNNTVKDNSDETTLNAKSSKAIAENMPKEDKAEAKENQNWTDPAKNKLQMSTVKSTTNKKLNAKMLTASKLVDSNTNDAFALDSKNGLHEHANVNANGGYDVDYWGKLNINDWDYTTNGNVITITGYKGKNPASLIIPNGADFGFINGQDTNNVRVEISSDVMRDLAENATRIGLSKTANNKIAASDAIWQDAFGGVTNEPGTMNNANGGIKYGSPNLTQMDLHNLDTSAITDMSALFNGGSNLTTVGDLSDWNTSNVTTMHTMFQAASSLTNIGDLSKWQTGNVTDMSNMFNNATSLTNIGDLSKWQTGNVTDMSNMFYNVTNLTNIGNLDNWDTSKVTDMHDMFHNATNLTNVGDLSKWQTGNVTNMFQMFANATNLTNIGNLDNWDTSEVTDMGGMFGTDTSKQSHLTNIGDLSKWQTGNVTNMFQMFANATNLTNIGNLDNWDTSKVTNMSWMFGGTTSLTNIGNLSKWQTGNVTNMSSMFYNATKLTNIGNLDNWDTSKVTNMSWMFGGTTSLTNIGNLSKWQTGNVTNMSNMFYNATKLTNIGNLDNWDTSKVTNMSWMFGGTTSLTNIGNLSKWQTGNVTNMSNMFMSAKALRHLNISNWDLTKLANKNAMKYMFANDANLTVIANDLKLPAWYQNEINDADYFWNNHMAVITNVPELIRATGDINNLKIDKQNTSRSIFYDSKGSNDAIQALKDANQAYINKYEQDHPKYLLALDASVDQTNPIALANAKFVSADKHLPVSNTNDAFALDPKNGLHEHANVNDNGGYDTDFWGKINVDDWNYTVNGNTIEINGLKYGVSTGANDAVIVPNLDDFKLAGKDGGAKTVHISTNTLGETAKHKYYGLSKTNGNKFVTDSNVNSAFKNDSNLTHADLNSLNTGNVTDMSDMFNGARSLLTSLDVSNWETGNVTNMYAMFSDASRLTSLDVSNWETGNVTNMGLMFNGASRLTSLDVSKWDTSKVTNMSLIFNGASRLTSLDVSKWNTGNVTNMSMMFNGASRLTSLDVSKWDTSKVTNMSLMFNGASRLTSLDVSKWNTGNVTNMSMMFNGASRLTSLDVSNWDTSKVTNMSLMFDGASSLTNLDVSKWDTSKVTNMSLMFDGTSSLHSLDVSKWNTGKVTDMSEMFYNASSLTDLDVSNWDTSKVTNMGLMFSSDPKLALIVNGDKFADYLVKNNFAGSNIDSGVKSVTTNSTKLIKLLTNDSQHDSATRTIVFTFPANYSPDLAKYHLTKTGNTYQIKQSVDYDKPYLQGTVLINAIYDITEHHIDTTKPYKLSDTWQPNYDKLVLAHKNADGTVSFDKVQLPKVPGYKAYIIVPNKLNPALFTVSFVAVPTENKPSTPVEETPSKPSAPTDNSNNSAWTDLKHKVVNTLNQSDSGWTMPETSSTYTVEVPADDIIDLSDLVIAKPIHAQTRTQIRVNKRFKLSKKHSIKHLKHRKKAVKSFKKYRL